MVSLCPGRRRSLPRPYRRRAVAWGVACVLLLAVRSAGAIQATSLEDEGGPKPEELASSLAGNETIQVIIDSVVRTGSPAAAGRFTGGKESLGIDTGVILSTGKVGSIAGPNDSDSTTDRFGATGDPDLEKLIGVQTFDASVLEFDFVPAGQEVIFRYVFGSDEYHEYVNQQFNDVFGFFINEDNLALLPDGKTVVSINTVNGGNPNIPDDEPQNPAFFVSNSPCFVTGDPPCPLDLEADGRTIVLTLRARVVQGKPNHIKLAIADVDDDEWDSWVFIEAGSLVIAEVCTNERDDDGDGKVDKEDEDCWICGDRILDPNEECDEGDIVDGDGCSALCRKEAPPTTTTTSTTTTTAPPTSTTTTSTTTTTAPRDPCTTDAGLPRDCDDANACTADRCDPAVGCINDPAPRETQPCDDGSLCTEKDECAAGACTGRAVSCDDGDACTADSCAPATGCVHPTAPADGASCDDGDACTASDVCAGGACGGQRECGPDVPPGSEQPVKKGTVAIPCTGAAGESCTVELFVDEPAVTSGVARAEAAGVALAATTRISKRVKPKKIKRRGRVVLKLSLTRAGRDALSAASGGLLPVIARATVGARGQPARVSEVPFSLLALRRRGAGR